MGNLLAVRPEKQNLRQRAVESHNLKSAGCNPTRPRRKPGGRHEIYQFNFGERNRAGADRNSYGCACRFGGWCIDRPAAGSNLSDQYAIDPRAPHFGGPRGILADSAPHLTTVRSRHSFAFPFRTFAANLTRKFHGLCKSVLFVEQRAAQQSVVAGCRLDLAILQMFK